jgi:hypothetical protein
MKTAISGMTSGDKIYFEDIRISMLGESRTIATMMITIR